MLKLHDNNWRLGKYRNQGKVSAESPSEIRGTYLLKSGLGREKKENLLCAYRGIVELWNMRIPLLSHCLNIPSIFIN